jgi:hypothetical protein
LGFFYPATNFVAPPLIRKIWALAPANSHLAGKSTGAQTQGFWSLRHD